MKNGRSKNTVILSVVLAVVLAGFAAALIYCLNIMFRPDEPDVLPTPRPVISEQGGQEKPEVTQGLDAVRVDLVDSVTYNLDELDFQFVIARIRVKAEEPIHISLEHFVTSEGIRLDQIDEYLNVLDSKGMYVGKQNVWFELISPESSYVANIFIPVKNKLAKEVSVDIDFGEDQKLTLDLSKPSGTKEMLGYVADDVITDGKTFQMQVGSAFNIAPEEMYRQFEDGKVETAGLPSTSEVYVFRLDAVSLWGDEVVIENAIYTTEGNSMEFEALPSGFYSEKYQNILGKPIHEKESGVLFFITYNPEREPITYQGKLKLKLKGQENWIEIKVSL